MSYQILARKYRPQRFDQLVGHQGIRSALINALNEKKLHHTYLMTGTRGVGKTSLARLFAKCLNCVKEVTSTPCGECSHCIAIQKGQFVDLIEVDAASRTRVEDMHSLLDNVQYKPTLGRYKVYLIDEVHMLSIHSFNALLKTLEEPPSHVVFLLATTDLQKVPETIISRCLHLRLQTLNAEEITQQLMTILDQENIHYETVALKKIAELAQGSIRDALSLLEPVILYHQTDRVTLEDVEAIFGYVDSSAQWRLMEFVIAQKVESALQLTDTMAKQSVDFEQAINELIEKWYHINLAQIFMKRKISTDHFSKEVLNIATQVSPEQVQLYYEIALTSKKHFFLAPTPELGFRMMLLRMIAFMPASAPVTFKLDQPDEVQEILPPQTEEPSIDWSSLVKQLPLTGFPKALALHCVLEHHNLNAFSLLLDRTQKILYNEERKQVLQDALSQYFKKSIVLHIKVGASQKATPSAIEKQEQTRCNQLAREAALNDQGVKIIQNEFNATVQSDAIHLETKKTS